MKKKNKIKSWIIRVCFVIGLVGIVEGFGTKGGLAYLLAWLTIPLYNMYQNRKQFKATYELMNLSFDALKAARVDPMMKRFRDAKNKK